MKIDKVDTKQGVERLSRNWYFSNVLVQISTASTVYNAQQVSADRDGSQLAKPSRFFILDKTMLFSLKTRPLILFGICVKIDSFS